MSRRKLLYESIFGSDEKDGKLLLDVADQASAKFIFKEACEESKNSTKLSTTCDSKVEATVKNLDAVVEMFENSMNKRQLFLKTYENCSPLVKELVEKLKEIAKSVEKHKFNCNVVKIVSGLVASLGGLLCVFFPLAAPIAAPAAVVLGAGVVAGTTLAEIWLKKTLLAKANYLIKQIQEEFKVMASWFELPGELKEAIQSLVDYKIFEEIGEDLEKFLRETTKQAKLTVGEFKDQFKAELQTYMKKMMGDPKISGMDDEIRPVVQTFLVVCLMKSRNQIVLNSAHITWRSVLDFLAIGLRGVEALGAEAVSECITKLFVPVAVVVNILVVLASAKDLTETSKLAKNINEAAAEFERLFNLLDGVYDTLKDMKSIPESDVIEWTTIIVLSVPPDAQQVDIKKAVKPYVPKEAHVCIKLEKLKTNGNNWLVEVPTSHSQMLLEQSGIMIAKKRCLVSQ